jgi:prepilin-type N-terminal cleavage/methylation domain-containing protein
LTNERGFTLLELLVSLAIAAILIAAEVAPFQRTILSRDRAERVMDQTSSARLTLQRLAEEMSGALPLTREDLAFRLLDRTLDQPSSEVTFATSNAQRPERPAIRSGPHRLSRFPSRKPPRPARERSTSSRSSGRRSPHRVSSRSGYR